MSTNEAMAWKIRTIKAIQAHGLRVLIRQRGAVQVWDKRNPTLEWEYPNLKTAHEDIQRMLGPT